MWNNRPSPFHPGAWLLWLGAAMLVALSTRNPYYLGLLIIVSRVVAGALQEEGTPTERDARPATGGRLYAFSDTTRRSRGLLLRLVVGLTLVAVFFKAISLHLGTTVLFSLPDEWPVIGGPITLESFIESGLEGLSILTVLAVFTAFSAGADYYTILRSLPPFLHQVGLVTSIAITFVPQTVTRFTEIRDATALRGHKIRRVRDLLPVIMPLLSGGMERSMNLAEAMEARGFSRFHNYTSNISAVMVQSALAIATGLILVGGALLALSSTIGMIGWLTIVAGVSLLGLTVRAVGLGNKRTRLRRPSWRERDTILASLCLGLVAFFAAYRFIAPLALIYYPFPSIYAPQFDPALGVAILLLAVPTGAGARFAAPLVRLGAEYSKLQSGKKS